MASRQSADGPWPQHWRWLSVLPGMRLANSVSQLVPVAVLPPLEADVIVAVEAPPAPTQVIRLGSGVPGDGGR